MSMEASIERTTYRTKRKLHLKWLQPNDELIPTLMEFLRKEFHPNEPLNRSIDLMNNQQDIQTLDALYMATFPYNASVVALDDNGNLVGVLLNDVSNRTKPSSHDENPLWNPSPKYEKFLDLLPTIFDDLKLFEKYPNVDNILCHAILSVANGWQGEGISQILLDYANTVIASKYTCGLSFVICSSYYSARVFEKCGYSQIWAKRFRDYVDNGEVLFPTEAPHDYITCQLLELK